MINEVKELVRSFYEYLKIEKGLGEKTASKHADEVEFFALNYLLGYEESDLLEVTGMDIEDYLGNWYIRKVACSRSDVRQTLVAFRKFYRFLYEKGYLGKDQMDDIFLH